MRIGSLPWSFEVIVSSLSPSRSLGARLHFPLSSHAGKSFQRKTGKTIYRLSCLGKAAKAMLLSDITASARASRDVPVHGRGSVAGPEDFLSSWPLVRLDVWEMNAEGIFGTRTKEEWRYVPLERLDLSPQRSHAYLKSGDKPFLKEDGEEERLVD